MGAGMMNTGMGAGMVLPPAPAMPAAMPMPVPGLDAGAMPGQEGWIKLRGIPFSVTKGDICTFLQVLPLRRPNMLWGIPLTC